MWYANSQDIFANSECAYANGVSGCEQPGGGAGTRKKAKFDRIVYTDISEFEKEPLPPKDKVKTTATIALKGPSGPSGDAISRWDTLSHLPGAEEALKRQREAYKEKLLRDEEEEFLLMLMMMEDE